MNELQKKIVRVFQQTCKPDSPEPNRFAGKPDDHSFLSLTAINPLRKVRTAAAHAIRFRKKERQGLLKRGRPSQMPMETLPNKSQEETHERKTAPNEYARYTEIRFENDFNSIRFD